MAFDAHANFALANVTVAPSPALSGTSLTVDDASLFPTPPFNATVWPATVLPTNASAEIVRVTNVASNVLTIVRAQEGSGAKAIDLTYQVAASLTAKILNDIESSISSSHGLPAGGTTGQSLTKNSSTDYDVGWTTVSGGSGGTDILLVEVFL